MALPQPYSSPDLDSTRLAEFDGIVVRIYPYDHNPPHFHVIYGEWAAQVGIRELEILKGELPTKVWRKVRHWATKTITQDELLIQWDLRNPPP